MPSKYVMKTDPQLRENHGKRTAALSALLLEMGKRPGGFLLCEVVCDLAHSAPLTMSVKLVRLGLLHRVKSGHRTVRFFGTAQAAMAHQAHQSAANPAVVIKAGRWPADLPAHYPLNADGSPAYKVTIAPPPPVPRFSNTHWQI